MICVWEQTLYLDALCIHYLLWSRWEKHVWAFRNSNPPQQESNRQSGCFTDKINSLNNPSILHLLYTSSSSSLFAICNSLLIFLHVITVLALFHSLKLTLLSFTCSHSLMQTLSHSFSAPTTISVLQGIMLYGCVFPPASACSGGNFPGGEQMQRQTEQCSIVAVRQWSIRLVLWAFKWGTLPSTVSVLKLNQKFLYFEEIVFQPNYLRVVSQ